MVWNGVYWKQKNNPSLYVTGHGLSGNVYTNIEKYALMPSGASGWANGSSVWYDTISSATKLNAYNICAAKGWHLPSLGETTAGVTNGIPSDGNWLWFNNGVFLGYGTHMFRGSDGTGSVDAESIKSYRCAY